MTFAEIVAEGRARHGDMFDPSDLASQFAPYYRSQTWIRVAWPDGTTACGWVGKTTGHRPAFLLMRSTVAVGSSCLLRADAKVVATREHGQRRYRPVR